MNKRMIAGILLAMVIGAFCRLFGVPLPAPTALVGALLVVSMTSGYQLAGRLLTARRGERVD